VAADNELRLISKAVRDRSIGYLLERGVQDDWFFVEENRAVWKFIREHYVKYSEVPTAVTVLDNFPTFRLLKVDDSVKYLLDQLIEYRNRQSIIDTVQEAGSSIAAGDHTSAITILSAGLHKISQTGGSESHDVDLTKTTEERWEQYTNIKLRPDGLIGMPTGFKTIDLATGGLQPGQLVTIIAPPKTGKSVLALQTAINLHLDGFVPMFQSFEMTNIEQQRRYDCMCSHISSYRFMRGQSTPEEEELLKAWYDKSKDMHPFYLTESITAMTLTALIAKVEKFKPDALFVDGVYLMEDEQATRGEQRFGSWQNLQHITQGMKRIAQRFDIPVIQTTQVLSSKVTKGKVTSDAIGYSSSFVQDSDVVLVLQRKDEEDDSSRVLRIDKSRSSGFAETELLWDWEQGRFEEYGNPYDTGNFSF
jgi:replicative DNA helicase